MGLRLRNNEIHIWYAFLGQPVSHRRILEQALSLDECIRAKRFHFEKDKKRFVVCRGILRMLLAHYLSVKPGKLQFCLGEYGKPALDDTFGRGGVYFNLSHSGDHALYAFTRGREIGVDIEQIRDISEMDKIADFSKREDEVFSSLPKSKKKEAFFNCWTRKEAFIIEFLEYVKERYKGLYWHVLPKDIASFWSKQRMH